MLNNFLRAIGILIVLICAQHQNAFSSVNYNEVYVLERTDRDDRQSIFIPARSPIYGKTEHLNHNNTVLLLSNEQLGSDLKQDNLTTILTCGMFLDSCALLIRDLVHNQLAFKHVSKRFTNIEKDLSIRSNFFKQSFTCPIKPSQMEISIVGDNIGLMVNIMEKLMQQGFSRERFYFKKSIAYSLKGENQSDLIAYPCYNISKNEFFNSGQDFQDFCPDWCERMKSILARPS